VRPTTRSWSLLSRTVAALVLAACSNLTGDEQLVADASALPAVNGQLGTVAASLADSVGVLVLDRLGQPMVGIPVQWRTDRANGVIEPANTLTDRSGVARANWRLDTLAGLQSATASVQGFATLVRVHARALPGAVVSLTVRDTTSGTLVVGRARTLITRRVDSYGNEHLFGAPRWQSLDPSVATVSSAGVVTGVLPGNARIVARQDAGVDTLIVPVAATGETDWIAHTVGGAVVGGHACAIDQAKRIWCWGYNDGGQLGTGTIVPQNAPVRVAHDPSLAFALVRAGMGTSKLSCALSEALQAYCWGEGALGNGSTARRTPTLVQMPVAASFDELQLGREHACARSTTGQVYCWGANSSGQTGHGATVTVASPRVVGGLDSVASLAVAADASCAATARGELWCWGRNSRGEMASGDTLPRATPRRVAGLPIVRSVHAGEQHFCAITQNGLWCWGRNDAGQLAIESSADQRLPVRIAAPSAHAYRQLSGGTRHSCAITDAGSVECWGGNADGQLGTGDTRDAHVPQRVTALGAVRFTAVSVSGNTSCALSASGELYCWGSDAQGQVGNGPAPAPTLPIRIARPRP
jgi:alpha-tubulin suppressor-like RCC1 family protein